MLSITSYLSASKTVLKTMYSGHEQENYGNFTKILSIKIKYNNVWVRSSFITFLMFIKTFNIFFIK